MMLQPDIDTIADWMEDFRLFCLSYWSDFYLLRYDLTVENVLTSAFGRFASVWMILKRQSILVQLIFTAIALFTILVVVIKIYISRSKRKCTSSTRLDGYTVLVTGANNGIGLETARDLASRGARLIMACRNMSRGISAAKDILETTGNGNLVVKILDLSSLQSVRQFAQDIIRTEERLDILVLNAGLALTKKYMTEDNLELHMATNHLGHFLLTNLLLPLVLKTAEGKLNQRNVNGAMKSTSISTSRIVIVSSVAHWWGKIELDNLNSEKYYESSRIYGSTKLANLLFCKELSRRLKSRGYQNILVNALHPGAVQTGLFRNIPYFGKIINFFVGLLYYTPKEGAQTSIYLSVSDEVTSSGEYYADCRPSASSPTSKDPKLAKQFWIKSVEMVQLEQDETVL